MCERPLRPVAEAELLLLRTSGAWWPLMESRPLTSSSSGGWTQISGKLKYWSLSGLSLWSWELNSTGPGDKVMLRRFLTDASISGEFSRSGLKQWWWWMDVTRGGLWIGRDDTMCISRGSRRGAKFQGLWWIFADVLSPRGIFNQVFTAN